MKKLLLFFALISAAVTSNGQAFNHLTADSLRIGKSNGTTKTAIYGSVLFKHVTPGLIRLNAIGQLIPTTYVISDVAGLQPALDGKVDKVTGKGLSTEDYTTAEKSKLAGIATGATANQTDAYLLSRSNHTGSQAISTVTGLQTNLDGKETLTNKATDFTTVDNTKYPSVQAVKNYADGLVVGLLNDRGSYDASTNVYPSSGGSGTAGAIVKGNLWSITVPGTLGGSAVGIGDWIRALVNSPGQTASNWAVVEGNFGYVPENVANKSTDLTASATKYPSVNAVNTGLATKAPVSGSANYIQNQNSTNQAADIRISGGVTALGGLGLGTAVTGNSRLSLGGSITGGTTAYGSNMTGTVANDVTTDAWGYRSNVGQASGFTLPSLSHFAINQGAFGGTVTQQNGFYVQGNMTGATSNYAFRSDVASGTGRWNLYMGGSAQNYLFGNLGIGSGKTNPSQALDVTGNGLFSGNVTASSFIGNASTATTLQTARTLWGQSFNGSANISGAISGASTITASSLAGSGNVIAGADNAGLMGKITIGSGLSLSGGVLTATGGTSGTVTTPGMTAGRLVVANSASDIGTTTALTISGSDLGVTGGVTASSFSGAGTGLTGTASALNIGGNAATVTTNANLTGVVTSTGNATAIADGALSIAKTSGLQAALDAKGTVSSVGIFGASGINVSFSPVTTAGTIDLSLGNITPSSVAASGTISGSNFSGSSSGTNTGDQTTITGNAGTATALQTARTIGLSGVTATATSFNGTSNITIPITAVPATLLTGTASINTSGNAATATALQTARNIQGFSFNGTADINPINGTGFVKATGTSLSYDNSTYLTTGAASSTYFPAAAGSSNPITNALYANGGMWVGAQINASSYIGSYFEYVNRLNGTGQKFYTDNASLALTLQPGGNALFEHNIAADNFSGSSSGTNTGDQTNITGNAGTVTNGVYTTGSYSNPSWITALAYSKLTGAPTIPTNTNQLTNGSGFITSSSLPTATSQLTNDSGFITPSAISGKEDVSNKSTSAALGSSDDLYPTQKAVRDAIANAVAGAGTGFTYTPTATAVGNINYVTPHKAFVTVTGNIVHVEGSVAYLASGTGSTSFRLSLPPGYESSFTTFEDLAGVATTTSTFTTQGSIYADETNDQAILTFTTTSAPGSANFKYSFKYEINN